jgi:hypothetical protein
MHLRREQLQFFDKTHFQKILGVSQAKFACEQRARAAPGKAQVLDDITRPHVRPDRCSSTRTPSDTHVC